MGLKTEDRYVRVIREANLRSRACNSFVLSPRQREDPKAATFVQLSSRSDATRETIRSVSSRDNAASRGNARECGECSSDGRSNDTGDN